MADRWHDSQPTFTALRPAATVPIHTESVPYAALANLSKVLVGTGSLEVLGIPAAHRYPDCATSFAHNPWDLIAIEGRIFIGLGDSGNEGPSANAGPRPVYVFDPEDRNFFRETTLPDEQIDRFYQEGSALFIPGNDPRQSWRWGNLYRRNPDGDWRQFRTLPRTLHTHALAWQDGRLFAGLSITEAVPEDIGSEHYGSAVGVSPDGGWSWQLTPLGCWRIFDFLQVGRRLYATDIFPRPGIQLWLDREQRQAFHTPVYELETTKPEAKLGFRRSRDLSAEALFPDTPLVGESAAIIERALVWGDRAAYLGAFARGKDPWPIRGAYLADSLTEGAVRVTRIPLPAQALAFDLRLEDQALQLLFAEPEEGDRWRNSI